MNIKQLNEAITIYKWNKIMTKFVSFTPSIDHVNNYVYCYTTSKNINVVDEIMCLITGDENYDDLKTISAKCYDRLIKGSFYGIDIETLKRSVLNFDNYEIRDDITEFHTFLNYIISSEYILYQLITNNIDREKLFKMIENEFISMFNDSFDNEELDGHIITSIDYELILFAANHDVFIESIIDILNNMLVSMYGTKHED